MTKEIALQMLRDLSPVPDEETEAKRRLYWIKITKTASDITKINVEFRPMQTELKTLFGNEEKDIGKKLLGLRSEHEIGAEVVRLNGAALEQWIEIALSMVTGFDEADFNTFDVAEDSVKGKWSYVADGENAFLYVNGTEILLTDPVQKRGKNYMVHLLDLLSFPERFGTITEDDFQRRLISIGESLTMTKVSKTFKETIKNINTKVGKSPSGKNFLKHSVAGCSINAAFVQEGLARS